VDAYVYDFEVAFVARAIMDDRTWALADLSGFVASVGGTVKGGPIPSELLGKSVADWVAGAATQPADPASFPALAVAALARARSAQATDAAGPAPTIIAELDPLQFVLAAASLLSRTGRLRTATASSGVAVAAFGLAAPREVAAGPCDQAKTNVDLDKTGLAKKYLKDYATDTVGSAFGDAAKDALKGFLKGVDLTGDGLSLALLLAGLDLFVSDDTNSEAHYRHREPAPKTYRYVAAVSFRSPFPDELIPCLGLAGVKLPPNGPLQGWLVKWKIEEDGDHVQPVDKSEQQKVDTCGTCGEVTGPNGLSTLKVQLRWELGCPSESTCGTVSSQGRAGEAIGIAQLAPDPNSLPVKLSDLFNLPKAAGKLLIDMVKNMQLPSAHHKVGISWHEPRFELVFESTVRIHVSGVPDGGGHVKATVKLEDVGPGTFRTGRFPEEGMSLSGHARLEFIKVFGNDNSCTYPQVPTLSPGEFTVVSAKPGWGTAESFPETPDFQDAQLTYTVAPLFHCPNGEFFEPRWKNAFDTLGGHGSGQYMETGFSQNGLTLTKRISVSKDGGLYTEDTTIILRPIP